MKIILVSLSFNFTVDMNHCACRRIKDRFFQTQLEALNTLKMEEVKELISEISSNWNLNMRRQVCKYLVQKIGELLPYEDGRVYIYALKKLLPSLDYQSRGEIVGYLIDLYIANKVFVTALEEKFGRMEVGRKVLQGTLLPLILDCIATIPLCKNEIVSDSINRLVEVLLPELTPANVDTLRWIVIRASPNIQEEVIATAVDKYLRLNPIQQEKIFFKVKALITYSLNYFPMELQLRIYDFAVANLGNEQKWARKLSRGVAEALLDFSLGDSIRKANLLFLLKLFPEE